MNLSMFRYCEKLQVRRANADNIVATMMPFFSSRWLAHNKMMYPNLFLNTMVPESSVAALFVQYISGPVPTVSCLVNVPPKPFFKRHSIWPAISNWNRRAVSLDSFIVHQANAAMHFIGRVGAVVAPLNLANLYDVLTCHNQMIPYGTRQVVPVTPQLLQEMGL